MSNNCSSWIRKFAAKWLGARFNKSKRNSLGKTRRPLVEHLEDRLVPTTYSWNPTAAGSFDWNNSANWTVVSGTGTTFPNAAGDVAIIQSALVGAETINLNQAITVSTLDIGDTSGNANAFTIAAGSGGSLTLSTATVDKTSGGADQITAPVTITGNAIIDNTLSAPNTLAFTSVPTLTSTPTVTVNNAAGDTGEVDFTAAATSTTGLSKAGGITVDYGTLGLNSIYLSSSDILNIANATANVNSSGTIYTTANGSTHPNVQVTGAGTLNLVSTTNSASSPDINFNYNDANNNSNWGTGISANINLGSVQRYFYGRDNHDSFSEYGTSADCYISGNISGSGGISFIAQNAYDSGGAEGNDTTSQTDFVLAGSDTFSGEVEITRGAVFLNNANALTGDNALLLDPIAGENAWLYLYGHSITVSSLTSTSAGYSIIANSPANAAAAATLTIAQSGTTSYNGTIVQTWADYDGTAGTVGALSLAMSGTGSLTLGGANTYTGTTTVNAGTLQAGSSTAFGSNSAVTVANVAGAILNLNNFNVAIGTLSGGGATGGGVTLGTGSLTLAETSATTFAGIVSGTGSLALSSASNSALTLSGANTFSGGVTNSGTSDIVLGNVAGLGTGTYTVNGSARTILDTSSMSGISTIANNIVLPAATGNFVLYYDGGAGNGATYTGAISGGETGTVLYLNNNVADGLGILRLSGTNSFTGQITVNRGAIQLDSGSALGSSTNLLYMDSYAPNRVIFTNSFTLPNPVEVAYAAGTFDTGANTDSMSGVISGSVGLIKISSGSLILSGTNTYTGGTTISAGTLQIGAGGTTGVLGGGAVADNGTLSFDLGTAESIGNAISGSGFVVQAGSGTTTLSGTNTYAGSTSITGGVLSIGSDANLGMAPGSTTTADIVLNGGTLLASGSFTLNSNRGIALGSASSPGSGEIDVAAGGTLTYGGIIADNTGGPGALIVGSGGNMGTLILGGANTFTGGTTLNAGSLIDNGTLGAATVNAGSLTDNGTLGAATVNAGSLTVNGTAGAVTVNGSGLLAGTGTVGAVMDDDTISPGPSPGAAGILSTGNLSFGSGGNLTLDINGAGTAGTNYDQLNVTATTSINLNNAILNLNVNYAPAIGDSYTILHNVNDTAYTGNFTQNGNTLSQNSYFVAGGQLFQISYTGNGGYDVVVTAVAAPVYYAEADGWGGSYSVGQTIANPNPENPSAPSAVFGGGAAVPDSGYTAFASVNAAIQQAADDGAIGATIIVNGGAFNEDVVVSQAVTLDLQYADSTFNSLASTVSNGSVQLSGVTLTTGGDDASTTFSSVITGSGNFEQTGTGTLALTGSSTITGTTTVDSGSTIQLGDGASAGTLGTGPVVDNGNLVFDFSGTVTVGNNISGTGSVVEDGTGVTILSGTNTYTGTTTVDPGTLEAGSSSAFGTNSAVIMDNVAGAVLNLNGQTVTIGSLTGGGSNGGNVVLAAGNLTIGGDNTTPAPFAGIISGNGTLTETGTGVLTLTGTNTYVGTTTINSGSTIQIGNGGSTGSLGTGNVTDSGTLVFDLSNYPTVSNNISGVGAIVQEGSGWITLAGTNTYTGSTTVDAGWLEAGSTTAFGTNSAVTLANVSGTILNLTNFNVAIGSLTGGGTNGGNVMLGTGNLTVGGDNTSPAPFYGTISGTGSGSTSELIKTGTGTLNIPTANALTTGNIVVSGGTLGINTITLSTSRTISIGSGAFVNSSGTINTTASSSVYPDYQVLGAGTLNLTSTTNSANSPDIYFNSNDVDGSTANWGTAISANVNLGSSQRYFWGKTNHNAFGEYPAEPDVYLTGSISGSGGITVIGQDNFSNCEVPFVLAGANTFTGMVEIQRGDIFIDNADALTGSNTLLLDPASGNNARFYLDGFNTTVANLQSTGAGTSVIANSPGSTAAAATLTIAESGDTTYAGTIVQIQSEYSSSGTVGALSIAETGTGTLSLTGTNTYTGTTTVSGGGTLSITADANLGADPASATPGNIVLNGGTLLASGSFALNINRGIAVGPSTGTGSGEIDVAAEATLTYGGIVANNGGGTGSLTVGSGSNSGTLSLMGTNTYTGGTSVDAGDLSVTADTNLGGIPAATTTANVVLNGGTLLASGSFTLNSYRGIALGSASSPGTGEIDVAAGGTLTYGGIIADNTGGPGALTVGSGSNTGTLTLGGTSTFTGGTTLAAGQLILSNSGTLGAVTVNAGTFQDDGTAGAVIVNGGILAGTGTAGAVTDNADIDPGDGPGAAGILNTDLSFGVGGTLSIDINGAGTAGINYDQLDVTGGVDLTNAVLNLNVNYTPAIGDSFTIIHNVSGTPITTTFLINGASVPQNGYFVAAGHLFQINYDGNGSNDVMITAAAAPVYYAEADGWGGSYAVGQTILNPNPENPSAPSAVYGGNTDSPGSGYTAFSSVDAAIQQSVDDGAIGATIIVNGGTFNEDVVVDQPVTLELQYADSTFNSLASTVSNGSLQLNGVTLNTGAGGATTAFSSIISGTGNLVKAGSGTMTLSGDDTYSGTTEVSGGILQLSSATALGTTSGVTVDGGGDLQLNGNSITVGSLAGSGIVENASATAAPATLTIGTANASTEFSGTLQDGNGGGALSLTETGTGTLILSGNDTYSGTTTISSGTLQIGDGNYNGSLGSGTGPITDNGTLAFDLASYPIVSNNITGTGAMAQEGYGVTTLSGNNTYTGSTTVDAGWLQAGSTSAFGTNSAVSLANNSGTTLNLNNFNVAIGSLTGGGVNGGNVSLGTGNLTVGGDNSSPAPFAGTISGTGELIKVGTGTLNVSTADALTTGDIVVSGGTLGINSITLTSSETISIAAGALVNSSATISTTANGSASYVAVAGPGTLNLTSTTNNATSPDINFNYNDANNNAYWGTEITANINLGGSQRYFYGRDNHDSYGEYGSSADAYISGAISGSGGISFIAQNSYENEEASQTDFVLAGANTFTGEVEITRGAVYLASAGALTGDNSLLLDPTAGTNAWFYLYGNSTTVSNLQSTGAGTSIIANSPGNTVGAATLTVAESGNTSYAGTIVQTKSDYNPSGTVGALSIAETGTGTLTLTGTNTYTGTTTVSGGVLNVGADANLGTDPTSAAAGNIVLNNGGTLQASGSFTLNGNRGIALGSANSPGTGEIDVAAGATLTYGGIIADNAGGSGALIVGSGTNTGTLTLSGDNTFTGGTTLAAGTLTDDGILGAVTVNGGVLAGTGTAGAVTDNGGIDPGTVPGAAGILNTGSLAFGTGGSLSPDINGAGTAGTNYDQLSVTGGVNLTNAVLDLNVNYAPTVGDSYTIIHNVSGTPVTGTFSNVNASGYFVANGNLFQVNYAGNGNNDIVVTAAPAPVYYAEADGWGGSYTVGQTIPNPNPLNPAAPSAVFGGGTASPNSGYTAFTSVNAAIQQSVDDGAIGALIVVNGGTFNEDVVVTQPVDLDLQYADSTFGSLQSTFTNGGLLLNGVSLTTGDTGSPTAFASPISGNGALIKAGTDTMTLSGNDTTFTGTIEVSNGVLAAGSATAFGANSTVQVDAAGDLQLGGYSVTFGSLTGSGIVEDPNAPAATVTVAPATADTFAGILQDGASGGPLSLTMNGAGTFTLSGNSSTYTGVTTVSGGVLAVADLEDGGSASSIGASTNAASNLVLDGGDLDYITTASTVSTDRSVTIGTAGGEIDVTDSGSTLTFTGAVNAGYNTLATGGEGALTFSTANALDACNISVNGGTLGINSITLSYLNTISIAGGANVDSFGTIFTTADPSVTPNVQIYGAGTLNLTSTTNNANTPDIYFDYNDVNNNENWGTGISANVNLGSSQRYFWGKDNHDSYGYYGQSADVYLSGDITGTGGISFIAQNSYENDEASQTDFVLAGDDTFTGEVEITRGAVYLASPTALTGDNALLMDPAPGLNAWFYLFGNSTTVSNLQTSGVGTSIIANSPGNTVGAATLTIAETGSTTFAGTIADIQSDYAPGGTVGSLSIAETGTGTLTLTGINSYSGNTTVAGSATLSIDSDQNLGADPSSPTAGNIVLNGGTLLATSYVDLDSSRGISLGDPSIPSTGGEIDVGSGDTLDYEGVIADNTGGTDSLTVGSGINNGTLILGGVNTYTGPSSVNNGTLLVNGSLAAASAVTVGTAGTLGGTGIVGGTTTVNGTLAPGYQGSNNPNGTGNLTADLSFGASSTFSVLLNSATSYDQLTVPVGGSVNLTGATLDITLGSPFSGGSFDILVNDTGSPITGNFTYNGSPLTEGSTFAVGSQQFMITYVGNGHDVVLTTLPAVTSSTASLPANAATVTIDGAGFDPIAANDSVVFNDGAEGTVTSATTTSLVVTFSAQPATAGSLTAIVTADSSTSGSPVQVATVTPVVTTNTASFSASATTLTIDGFGFDPNAGNDSVSFNHGAAGSVTGATATTLTVTFSTQPATAGSLTAVVTTDSITSGSPVQVATVVTTSTAPTVATNTADLPANAATLTIDGTGFDPLAGNNTVSFNDGAAGTVTNATTTTLTVSFSTDPTTAGSLTAVVTADSLTSGSAVQVATVTPVVTTNTAGMLQHTPTLTISGYGFDPIAGNNTVTFNDGAAGTVTSATATTLVVTFTTAPTAAGSLTAVVTTDTITSGAAVQVATVTSVTSVTVNGDYAPIVDISSNGSGTVTATTDGNNGFTAGNTVVISGYTGANAGYDGTFTVQSASGDQFTVTNTTPSLPTLSSNTAGFAISQNTASALRGVQRSMVDSVVYTFTAPVSLTASNFTLTTSAPSVSGAPSAAPAPATLYPGMALTSLAGGSIWVVTWVSGGGTGATVSGHSLADGVYNITLGNSNEGTDTFFRLYGNVVGYNSTTHNASLNNQDSLTFTHSYLLSTGATQYLADCDYDANGVINNTDSLNFTHRYLSVWSGFVPTI